MKESRSGRRRRFLGLVRSYCPLGGIDKIFVNTKPPLNLLQRFRLTRSTSPAPIWKPFKHSTPGIAHGAGGERRSPNCARNGQGGALSHSATIQACSGS